MSFIEILLNNASPVESLCILPPWILPVENRLAFLIGKHTRLGRSALVLHIDTLVLRLVLEFADALAPPVLCL